jgi:RimJ/RimL family protein N-acetyltransferase
MNKEAFIYVDSKRLILRRIQDGDFDALFFYRNDPTVGKYQSWTDKTENELRVLIQEQSALQPGIPGEWFMFAIQLKETEDMIGDCAFNINKDYPQQAELGITLSRQYQGKGYAKEAVGCALNYAFKNFSIERLIMITDKENTRSISLINKLGFSLVNSSIGFKEAPADKDLYCIKGNELMYAIVREGWTSV